MMPLEGVRILDWTVAIQGPFATALLGSLGAEIIKIEEKGKGDLWRVPSLKIGSAHDAGVGHGRNYYFEAFNFDKKGLALDLKKEAGKQIIYRLVEKSDAFVTNLRKPVAAKLGMDYQTLSRYNPELIYGVASGLGKNGPDTERPAFDFIGQTRSGATFLEDEKPPLSLPIAFADHAGAVMLAMAVLAGLVGPKRRRVGQEVEVSQLGAMMCLQFLDVTASLFKGSRLPRTNRAEILTPLINTYKCGDGKWIALAMGPWSERGWPAFCKVLGMTDLAKDPRFITPDKRRENNRELIRVLDGTFATRPREDWMKGLEKEEYLVFGPVNDIPDLVNDPQVIENQYIVDFAHPVLGNVKMPGVPFQFTNAEVGIRIPAPELGEHNEQILAEVLGYSEQQIRELKEQGVI